MEMIDGEPYSYLGDGVYAYYDGFGTWLRANHHTKFECTDEKAKKYFDIITWNKHKVAFLNRQIIILLKALKIPNSHFMKLQ